MLNRKVNTYTKRFIYVAVAFLSIGIFSHNCFCAEEKKVDTAKKVEDKSASWDVRFRNETFEREPRGGWANAWTGFDGKLFEVPYEQQNHFVRIPFKTNTKADKPTKISRIVRIDPTVAWVEVDALIRFKREKDSQSKAAAGVVCKFVAGDGSIVKLRNNPNGTLVTSESIDWTEMKWTAVVPAGAKGMRITLGGFSGNGVIDIDDVVINPVMPARLRMGAAFADYSVMRPEESGYNRGVANLNGIWRFRPVSKNVKPEDYGWGGATVPGGWGIVLGKTEGACGIVLTQASKAWKDVGFGGLKQAEYQRRFSLPSTWYKRRLVLSAGKISGTAKILIDGKECGEMSGLCPKLDITDKFTPARSNTLSILLSAPADGSAASISGNFDIASYPNGARLENVFVRASGKGDLAVSADVADLEKATEVDVVCVVTSLSGKRLVDFKKSKIKLEKDFSVGFPWKDPAVWKPGEPTQCHISVMVKGKGIEDHFVKTFGFRPVKADGSQLLIGDTQLSLRVVSSGVMRAGEVEENIRKDRKDGFNAWIVTLDLDSKSENPFSLPAIAAECDRIGWPLILKVNTEEKGICEKSFGKAWRRVRDNASIIAYMVSATNGKKTAIEKSVAVIRKIDSSRPIISSKGGDVLLEEVCVNGKDVKSRVVAIAKKAGKGKSSFVAVSWDPKRSGEKRSMNLKKTWSLMRMSGVSGIILDYPQSDDSASSVRADVSGLNQPFFLWLVKEAKGKEKKLPIPLARCGDNSIKLKKSDVVKGRAMLFNNSCCTVKYDLNCKITANGSDIVQWSLAGNVEAGERVYLPVRFPVTEDYKSGAFVLSAKAGDWKGETSFPFEFKGAKSKK